MLIGLKFLLSARGYKGILYSNFLGVGGKKKKHPVQNIHLLS